MWNRFFFLFKQKTANEMRISDWSSDVCSSDLPNDDRHHHLPQPRMRHVAQHPRDDPQRRHRAACGRISQNAAIACASRTADRTRGHRSEEHTSELQSLMRISYAVFCLKKTKNTLTTR